MTADLLSLVLTLRPDAPATLPPRLGRAAYAVLLDRLRAHDPTLAAQIHDGDGPKPVTCSGLMGSRPGGSVAPEATYTLRYTALTAPTAAALRQVFPIGERILFEGVPFTVEGRTTDPAEHPWAGTDGYQALVARYLTPGGGARPPRRWTLVFAAPTAFKTQGSTQPLPLPSLVFASLVARWNAFAPVALPAAELHRYAESCLVLSRFSLRSAPGWDRGPGLRIGAIGQATYRATTHDRYWHAALSLLAAFARYAGVGTLTTMGMGQVRWEAP